MTVIKKTHKAKKTTNNKHTSLSNTKLPERPYKWHEDYFDLFTFRKIPLPEIYFERLAKELVTWVDSTKEALAVKEFRNLKKISHDVWNDWLHKFPALKSANTYAIEVMGERREKILITRDPSSISFMMPHYDKDWKDMTDWRSNLKKEAETQKENKTIILERLESGELKQIVEAKPVLNEEV